MNEAKLYNIQNLSLNIQPNLSNSNYLFVVLLRL